MAFSDKHKLLVVDDSAFMRKIISDFFNDHPTIEVVGTARNGQDALRKVETLRPDVVTLDVEMPVMDGIEALKEIMKKYPMPVVMLSSKTREGTHSTLSAMENGAFDFVAKPSGTISLDLHKVKDILIETVEQAVKVPKSKFDHSLQVTKVPSPARVISPKKITASSFVSRNQKIVLIGTSTGGPRALQNVITKIPKQIKAPILIVQHMPAGFTKSLAERLNQLSAITVKEAEDGDILQNGVAYVAPGGYHLRFKKVNTHYVIALDKKEPPRSGHRPSVDVMFEDISRFKELDKVAVVMTGMGADGAKGLTRLKKTGNTIAIAESAETCIVYGMPKAAVETQLVDEVVFVEDIAQTIMKYLP
ncbi:chemotaxis response regulator protein-glutamate methylesterase [Lysinibacillus alkalisoli]|uniref:Protein-glutamate methylesterase/protein-glutamine glutaminase n=2 Tax=Lysinibacillus alkalisoli TaxID=1911548 RepID=A0A917G4J7_9BACI|nr:chemotaxis response regulator protein-glutamate methylesterase [Lysinibacillus alkalisoli]GGG21951.1 chemotaxis response regulator protein-glutamate methylesterase [Lysinibacillus alkalisoli]